MNNLLWIDTETGGLRSGFHSLLSFALLDQAPTAEPSTLDILVRHDTYVVDPEALSINGIDLVSHHAQALEPAEVVTRLEAFLDARFPGERVTLAGHNVAFDRAFLMAYLEVHSPSLMRRFSHRMLDTHTLAMALREAGRLRLETLSSDALFAHFDIQVPEGQRHTALGDVLGTVKVYQRLLGLIT